VTSPFRTVATALRALGRNVLRSGLTTLGIVIGVAAVIAMMEIGNGSAHAIQDTIARMGSNNIMVLPGSMNTGAVNYGTGSRQTLNMRDFEVLVAECSDRLASAAPVVLVTRTQVVHGNRNWIPTYLYGTTPEYLDVRQWHDLDEGQMFTEADVRRGVQVCVIGRTLATALFDDRSPLGQVVRLNQQPFKVIGVLSQKGANMVGSDQDDILLAPWTAIKYRVAGRPLVPAATAESGTTGINTLSRRYPSAGLQLYPTPSESQLVNNPRVDRVPTLSLIWARAGSADDIPAAKQQIEATLRREHRLEPEETTDFVIRDMTEQGKVLGSTAQLMSALLLSVALISLAVGGVGIMNIMLVSVTERTREIGLRMAVGARPGDILRQFVVEAMVLCLIGGAIGIVVGRVSAELVQLLLRWPTRVSPAAIIASVTVSGLVGLLFGFYPAWKASRLDPIQALRYE
jgi:ABC-type antimicrobial peptide transport system permease subunit